MGLASDMRRLQRRAKGGRVELALEEDGAFSGAMFWPGDGAGDVPRHEVEGASPVHALSQLGKAFAEAAK